MSKKIRSIFQEYLRWFERGTYTPPWSMRLSQMLVWVMLLMIAMEAWFRDQEYVIFLLVAALLVVTVTLAGAWLFVIVRGIDRGNDSPDAQALLAFCAAAVGAAWAGLLLLQVWQARTAPGALLVWLASGELVVLALVVAPATVRHRLAAPILKWLCLGMTGIALGLWGMAFLDRNNLRWLCMGVFLSALTAWLLVETILETAAKKGDAY